MNISAGSMLFLVASAFYFAPLVPPLGGGGGEEWAYPISMWGVRFPYAIGSACFAVDLRCRPSSMSPVRCVCCSATHAHTTSDADGLPWPLNLSVIVELLHIARTTTSATPPFASAVRCSVARTHLFSSSAIGFELHRSSLPIRSVALAFCAMPTCVFVCAHAT